MSDVTRILSAVEQGDSHAAEQLLPLVYEELRHFAGLGHEQVAAAPGLTVYQARQKWTYARARLRHALGK
jgi:hypothetical protein